jgi:hypothetical protein
MPSTVSKTRRRYTQGAENGSSTFKVRMKYGTNSDLVVKAIQASGFAGSLSTDGSWLTGVAYYPFAPTVYCLEETQRRLQEIVDSCWEKPCPQSGKPIGGLGRLT